MRYVTNESVIVVTPRTHTKKKKRNLFEVK